MSKLFVFREMIHEILSTAALEILSVVEKMLAENKEEICRSEEERKRLQRLLNVVNQPNIADEQHQIQEEQELWTNQEEEQLQGLQAETTDSKLTQESEFSNVKMSKLYMMREFVSERLTTAASEIFGAVEIMIGDFKEEISRSKEESKRTQRLFDIVTQPAIKLPRTDEQHPSLLEPPQIKEEQEQELWTNQEEEQLQGLQAETTDSIFTSLSVEHDSDQEGFSECPHQDQAVQVDNREEDSLPSNTSEEQIKAEPHVQDCAAPEPVSDSQPLSVVAPDCPAAQRLEEHGAEMFLQETISSTITQVYSAVPGGNMSQAISKGVKAHQCTVCSKRFTQKCNLAAHMRIHTGEKRYQCQQCSKRFTFKTNLVEHKMTHTGEKPYQCPHCNKRYVKKAGLVVHLRTHTGEKPFQCQECNNTFSRKESLVAHMRLHTGVKPYQCQECNKLFTYKVNMVQHMRTHTGEKPYKCQQCAKVFALNSCLVKHMTTHSGEKPFQCQQCSKVFVLNSCLVKHMRTHTGEKPYKCQQCSKVFALSGNLVKHMRTHTGEKPYQCQQCSKLFALSSNLVKHMRTHR